ncbi:hypothetical protein [Sulfitobacter sp.]|uniref:hypothetical protein n=1 Tax=Sulfitobacter sp. TaxID=1903071 RepID=UPI003001CBA7
MYKGIDEDIYCDRGGDFRTYNATDNYGICTNATVIEIMDHGTMLCSGYNGSYFGFVEVNDKNDWMGLDVDLCRALTTVILGGGRQGADCTPYLRVTVSCAAVGRR